MMATLVKKRTISFKPFLYEKLEQNPIKNKSLIVNNALKLYFKREAIIKKAEIDFWKDEWKTIVDFDKENIDQNDFVEYLSQDVGN